WQGFDVDVYDPYFYPDKKYKSKRYDLITCTEVLEHIAKPYQVLRDLLEHLKPGGIMAVMTHFHQKDDADFDFKQWWYNNDPTHITFYSRKTIKWIASEFELKLIYLGKSKMATFQKA
ncbi:MAG: class I SAM-dependent methyltransferase, partial [Halanaerobiales bacterium]